VRCGHCGYPNEVGVGTDVCDSCGERLGGKTYGLLGLRTVFTRRRERISSDEEERRRAGFELEVSYRFHDHGERPGRVEATASASGGNGAPAGKPLISLTYGDSATIRIANVGRKRRKTSTSAGSGSTRWTDGGSPTSRRRTRPWTWRSRGRRGRETEGPG
jgi:hypothetical protein